MRSIGDDHGATLLEHEALRKAVRLAPGGLHHRVRSVRRDAFRLFANRQLAAAGFHIAKQTKPVMGLKDFFFPNVAVEVQTVQVETLRLLDLALGQLRSREQAVVPPESPGDRGVQLQASSVQPEESVGPKAFRRKPTKAKRDIPLMDLSTRALQGGAEDIKLRRLQVPQLRVWCVQRGGRVRAVRRPFHRSGCSLSHDLAGTGVQFSR